MVQKNKRVSKPITVTLSPQAQEAIEILKTEEETTNVSYIVDKAIKSHIQALGYVAVENEMFNEVTAEIISNGVNLPRYEHQDQVFLKAPGVKSQYTIRLTNKSAYYRKLVVISVDGRSVMTGELANESDNGYVLNPGQTFDLTGWRRTADEVAAFEFVDLEASYDKQVGGSGSNVGVIGIAVFSEKRTITTGYASWTRSTLPPYSWEYPSYTVPNTDMYRSFNSNKKSLSMPMDCDDDITYTCSAAGAAMEGVVCSNAVSMSLTSEIIGTGYGEKKAMPTVSVSFDREDHPSQKIVLRYATESTLKKWGVIKENIIPQVNPFPKEKQAVPAPPGWRG